MKFSPHQKENHRLQSERKKKWKYIIIVKEIRNGKGGNKESKRENRGGLTDQVHGTARFLSISQ